MSLDPRIKTISFSEDDWKAIEEDLKAQKEDAEKEALKNKKIGRNDPCPCGSGKKYKNCCLNKQEG